MTNEFYGNSFELTGRVNYIKLDYGKSGNAYTRLLISKKGKDNEYFSIPITLFGDTAQAIGEGVDKGDTVNIKGMIKSEEPEGTKEILTRLIGLSFVKVEYDEDKGRYVEATGKKKTTKKEVKQGELPWA